MITLKKREDFPETIVLPVVGADSCEVRDWAAMGHSCAVVLLFVPGEGSSNADLVMMRRSTRVRTHKGQVGFAGGRRESQDETPEQTGLRELEEELGVPRDLVEVTAVINPHINIDGAAIYPVLATSTFTDFQCNEEVEYAIRVPWDKLTREKNQPFHFTMFGCLRNSERFVHEDVSIWGLSAEIIHAARFSAS